MLNTGKAKILHSRDRVQHTITSTVKVKVVRILSARQIYVKTDMCIHAVKVINDVKSLS